MKELKGTERQIKFATDIRNYVIYQLESFDKIDKVKAEKFIKALSKQGTAKFIIDNFVDSFKQKNIRAIALDYFKYEALEKVTQSELKKFQNRAITINELEKDLEFKTEKLEKATPKVKETPISYISEPQDDYIKTLLSKVAKDPKGATEILEKYRAGEKITRDEASELIEALRKTKLINKSSTGPKYFTAKFFGEDCETKQLIKPGDLCVKVGDGIILAENY